MLRPEGTTSIVRALINGGLSQNLPKRYFYYGPMFRYERPQKGRLRQFHQFGVELLGVKEFYGDLEVIKLAYDFLKSLKLSNDFILYINSLGDTESRLKYRENLIVFFDNFKNELSRDSLIRLTKNPLRILDSKDENDIKIIENAPKFNEFLNVSSKLYFDKICNGLEVLNIPYKIDQNLVRGLDYYSHTTFEFKTDSIGSQNTILAGGRYDELSKMISKFEIPGIGWAAGVERLALMIKKNYIFNPEEILTNEKEDFELEIFNFYSDLLNNGIQTKILYSGTLSKKLKKASKLNAKFFIILSKKKQKYFQINCKNLDTGEQKTFDFTSMVQYIKSHRSDNLWLVMKKK